MTYSTSTPPRTYQDILDEIKDQKIYNLLYRTRTGTVMHHRYTDQNLQLADYHLYMSKLSVAASDVIIWED